jgi:hypothetical protein
MNREERSEDASRDAGAAAEDALGIESNDRIAMRLIVVQLRRSKLPEFILTCEECSGLVNGAKRGHSGMLHGARCPHILGVQRCGKHAWHDARRFPCACFDSGCLKTARNADQTQTDRPSPFCPWYAAQWAA